MSAAPYKSRVWVEGFPEDVFFECWLRQPRELWNGFDCPYFTKAQAEKVAATFNADPFPPEVFKFDAATNAYHVKFWDDSDPWVFGACRIEGVGEDVFAIGAWGWCWQEVSEGGVA